MYNQRRFVALLRHLESRQDKKVPFEVAQLYGEWVCAGVPCLAPDCRESSAVGGECFLRGGDLCSDRDTHGENLGVFTISKLFTPQPAKMILAY